MYRLPMNKPHLPKKSNRTYSIFRYLLKLTHLNIAKGNSSSVFLEPYKLTFGRCICRVVDNMFTIEFDCDPVINDANLEGSPGIRFTRTFVFNALHEATGGKWISRVGDVKFVTISADVSRIFSSVKEDPAIAAFGGLKLKFEFVVFVSVLVDKKPGFAFIDGDRPIFHPPISIAGIGPALKGFSVEEGSKTWPVNG